MIVALIVITAVLGYPLIGWILATAAGAAGVGKFNLVCVGTPGG